MMDAKKTDAKAKSGKAEGVVSARKPKPDAVQKVVREERNGVKRPAHGGLCASVWEWLDANPNATIKEVRDVAPEKGWNLSNCQIEYYQWRKFMGLSKARLVAR